MQTPLAPEEVVARLDALARRGKLPGFARGRGEDLFEVAAFGHTYDYRLVARGDREESGTRLEFRLVATRRVQVIYAAVIAFTVWPGVWFTDRMIQMWFGGYYGVENEHSMLVTCLWYLPLTVLPVPFFWRKMVRNSRAAAEASAVEMLTRMRGELGASGQGPGAGGSPA